MLLRFALIWMGIYLGLVAGTPESVAAVQILVWPLGFLSNAFTDPASMPGWLGAIAEWNPLSATAAAMRELFGNPGWGGDSWAATHAVELAVVWPVVLTAVFFPLAVARYRARLTASTPSGGVLIAGEAGAPHCVNALAFTSSTPRDGPRHASVH